MVKKSTYETLEKRIQELEQEVVDHKHAENKLKESEKKYKLLAERSADVIYKINLKTEQYTYVSPSIEKIFGYTVKEGLSLKAQDTLTADSYAKQSDILIEAIASNCMLPKVMELEAVHKDGHTLPVEIHANFILDNQENPVEILGIVRDITEQRLFTDTLKKSEERFKFLAENMGDIVWTLDMDLNTSYVSPSVEKVLGYTVEERKQKEMKDMLTPKSLKRIMALFVKELECEKLPGVDPDRSVNISVEYFHKNGSTVWMENTVKAIRDESNAVVGMYGVSHDITERKLFMNKLKEINNTLEQKVKKRTADLEDMNAALRVLLKKRNEDKIEMEERLFANFKLVISPFIKKLKSTLVYEVQKDIIDILESELKDIISPFAKKLSDPMVALTPTEIEIAGLIKFGKSNKEIAEIQNSAIRTVAYHRENIRKKLDLKNKKINLKSYLLTMQ